MSLSSWAWLMAWFAAELTALVAGAAVLQFFFRSPRAGKILWQAAFTSVALVMIVEFTGMREKMPGLERKQHHHFVITTTTLPASAQDERADERTAEVAPVAAPAPAMVKWPGWLWLAGASLLLARSLIARTWLDVRRRAATPADEDSPRLIAHLQKSLGLRAVQSQVWPGLRSPVAFGIFRPTIALPPDFVARFTPAERQAMLAHEMAHLAARDPFWLMVSDAVIALAWWHPLVWWARHKLQIVSEAAADEASALIPGGPCALAECLVRLGRELTGCGPARSLGVGGNGPRSQLAARIARLLGQPQAWRPSSMWARWTPHLSAVFVALASALLPIQTGLSGSILAVFAAVAPAHAETPPARPAQRAVTNQSPSNTFNYVAVTNTSADLIVMPNIQAVPCQTVLQLVTNIQAAPEVTFSVVPAGSGALSYQWAYNGSNLSGTPVLTLTNPPVAPKPVTSPTPMVKLRVQAVSITEHDSDEIGLDWIFGLLPTNNPAIETSHDLSHLHTFPDRHFTNNHPKSIVVDHLRTDGQSAILNAEQFAALLDRIRERTGADIVDAPAASIGISGCLTHLGIQDGNSIVTGVEAADVSPTNTAGIQYFTDDIYSGFVVDLVSKAVDEDKWHLRVLASLTKFLSYDVNDKKLTVDGIGYQVPLPHFRVLDAGAEDTLPLGQTMAVRGPLWTETTKTKAHFLVRAKTKTTRHRLYIFVTPTRLSPDSH